MMEDDVTLEEELLIIEDNREINPDHNLTDKEECGEASKQEQEPARATERENPKKRRHKDTPTLPTEERIKRAQKAIESLKRHSDNGTCPASFRYRARANVQRTKNLLMLSLASTKDKSLASKVNYNAARGQNLQMKLLKTKESCSQSPAFGLTQQM